MKPELTLLRSEIEQGLQLTGASFERSLIVNSSDVGRLINAERVRIGGALVLRLSDINSLRLLDAEIEGGVSFMGSAFERLVNADGVRVGGSLLLRDSEFFEELDLLGADVGDDIQFGDSRFEGAVDMTGTRVAGEILLSGARHGAPEWGADARLILRNVSADALQAEERAWTLVDGSPLPTDLTGFAYARLGGLTAAEGETMADSDAKWLAGWIADQPYHNARYDPQPYEQLAAALDAAGATGTARRIRYEKFEHKRRAANVGLWETARLHASRWLIGHGLWFAGLVALGMAAAWRGGAPELRGFWPKLWYSLENALPLVELKPGHKEIAHPRPWVENFFHAQKLIGFALATILVGALTLLGG